MRFVIQRVSSASVTIDGKVRGEIGKGFVVLIGIGEDDTKEIADKLEISVRTVASHVRTAVLFLREDLKDLLILYIVFLRIIN